MARVPYIDAAALSPEMRAVLGAKPINIRRALANSPESARANGNLAMHIRHHSRLDPRLREMAILQVGYSARSIYEYAHHLEIAREFGVSDDDMRAIAADSAGKPTKLDRLTKAVLSAAREMTATLGIADATYAVLREGLDNERFVDLVLAIAFYNATVRILESLKVDLEPEYQALLDQFPLPPA